MSMTDPIADMLTRIRNASRSKKLHVVIPHSNFKEALVRLLHKEGYIVNVEVNGEGVKKQLVVALKYSEAGESVFHNITRYSKTGCRMYWSNKDIRPLYQGAGMALLSTPKGLMKDDDAKRAGVGGEVICTVW